MATVSPITQPTVINRTLADESHKTIQFTVQFESGVPQIEASIGEEGKSFVKIGMERLPLSTAKQKQQSAVLKLLQERAIANIRDKIVFLPKSPIEPFGDLESKGHVTSSSQKLQPLVEAYKTSQALGDPVAEVAALSNLGRGYEDLSELKGAILCYQTIHSITSQILEKASWDQKKLMYGVSLPTFRNNKNEIVYDMPQGKMVRDGESGQPKRVKIEASKGVCFYAAMDWLSNAQSVAKISKIYADNLPGLLEKIADGETFVSQRLFRNDLNDSYNSINWETADRILSVYTNPDSPDAREILTKLGNDISQVRNYFPEDMLKGFKKSKFTSFYDYLLNEYCSRKIKCYMEFLKKIEETSFFYHINDAVAKDPGSLVLLKELQQYVQSLMAVQSGFRTSDWDPGKDISQLLEELRQHGPLIVGGKFGRTYYQEPSIEFEKGNLPTKVEVHYWNSTSNRRVDNPKSHVVIIVGCVKDDKGNNGGVVYFLDPNDSSDPGQSQYRIYTISYKNLKENSSSFELMKGYALFKPNTSD